MSRLFISHSSKDSVAAIAFKQWLGSNGWPQEDVFLDLENIGAGEVWKEALRKAHLRCEAVILLASPDALSSPECLAELRKAEDFGKEVIVVLLRDLTIEDQRLGSFKARQIVDLSAPPLTHTEKVDFRGTQHDVAFNDGALLKIKDYLFRRGITPDSFPWPPEDRPDAEPFPGLRAFSEDEAGIFFGRDADILHGLDEFRLLRRNGSPRVLAIQASSGAGKSSFLRAGLWPRLCRDPDFAALAIVRPAQGILTGTEGLARKLAPQLSRPDAPVNPGQISARLMAQDAARTVAEFAKLMTAAAADAREQRRIVNPDAPPPALVIAIDQAEELLAPEDAEESERFLVLLAGLMREPPPGVEPFALITVRADTSTRVYQAIVDHKMEPPKTLTLLPLPQTSYRDVILKPIELMARRGRRVTISPQLVDQLAGDATGADALPLLAFTLSYLYQAYAPGGVIGLEQYKEIGGVAGAIDKALKQALARPGDAPAIPAAPAEQLACLRATFIPWLTRIEPETNEPKRRVARLDEFAGPSRAIVDRLVKARLLVVDQRGGIDVVEVAHESVLRQWPPLASWIQAVADDLRIVDSVESAAREWERNGRLAAWLDHRADRLSAAERLAAQEDFRRRLRNEGLESRNRDGTDRGLPDHSGKRLIEAGGPAGAQACRRLQRPVELDYLAACREAEQIALRRSRLVRTLIAALALLLIAGLIGWMNQAYLFGRWRQITRVAPYIKNDVRPFVLTAEAERAQKDPFRECRKDCPLMVVIPAGRFMMGSPAEETGRQNNEDPQHDVAIARPFAISEFEVTFDDWDACVSYGDCRAVDDMNWGRGQRPVINVTWQDARKYVEWLAGVTGKPYRLPSEAEWEYAARAGKQTAYSWGDKIGDGNANCNGCNSGRPPDKTQPVNSFAANAFGLYNVHGNVWEWVEDCYHTDYRGAPSNGSAWISGDCEQRVARGGGWYSVPPDVRSARRLGLPIPDIGNNLGFRITRTLTQ